MTQRINRDPLPLILLLNVQASEHSCPGMNLQKEAHGSAEHSSWNKQLKCQAADTRRDYGMPMWRCPCHYACSIVFWVTKILWNQTVVKTHDAVNVLNGMGAHAHHTHIMPSWGKHTGGSMSESALKTVPDCLLRGTWRMRKRTRKSAFPRVLKDGGGNSRPGDDLEPHSLQQIHQKENRQRWAAGARTSVWMVTPVPCPVLWCSHLCSLPCTVMLTPVLSALHYDGNICVPCTTLLWKKASFPPPPALLFRTRAESEYFLSCPEVFSTATVTCFSPQILLYFKSQYPIVQRHFQFLSLKAGAKPLRNTPSRLWKQCMWTHRHIHKLAGRSTSFRGVKKSILSSWTAIVVPW